MSLPREYFERLYELDGDPWGFRSRWYEQRKRALTMACLPDSHYGTAFEPGCSIGLLTAELATRCGRVTAMDVSERALGQAGALLGDSVALECGTIPADWPDGTFDLVVLSEVGYYLSAPECRVVAEQASTSTRDLVAVHWRHEVADYPLGGDQVHQMIADAATSAGMSHITEVIEADLRIDVWSADDRSVGQRTGLVE